jgi:hypothetical protein
MSQLTTPVQDHFYLEESPIEEEYFLLKATNSSGIFDGTTRAKFHVNMGKDTAIAASKAIAQSFNMPFIDKTSEY